MSLSWTAFVSRPARNLIVLVFLSTLFSGSTANPVDECSGMATRLRAFKLIQTPCNFTTLKDTQLKKIQAPATIIYIPILYLITFTIGLPANLLALWVLVFRTKKLPSTILLINLTTTDLMLMLVLPFRIVYHFRGNDWGFGEPFCRVVMAMFYGNMYGCVLCLAFIALDRYIALVHPFGAKTLRSKRTSLCMSFAVWAAVIAAMIPLLVSEQSYKVDTLHITTCHDALPEKVQENYFLPYFATMFTICFLMPFLVILFCYGAILRTLAAGGKRYSHAVRVTVLVMVVFVVCLLPSNILLILTYSDTSDDVDDDNDLYLPYMVSLAVSTFNSCIDPFIFYYVSEEFREKARNTLCCRGASKTTSSSGNQVSYSSSQTKSKVTLLSNSSRQGTFDENVA